MIWFCFFFGFYFSFLLRHPILNTVQQTHIKRSQSKIKSRVKVTFVEPHCVKWKHWKTLESGSGQKFECRFAGGPHTGPLPILFRYVATITRGTYKWKLQGGTVPTLVQFSERAFDLGEVRFMAKIGMGFRVASTAPSRNIVNHVGGG